MWISKNTGIKILFISPGASLTGHPLLFLKMMRWLNENSTITPVILTSGKGPLEEEYSKLAKTYKWDGQFEPGKFEKYYLARFIKRIARKFGLFRIGSYNDFLIKNLQQEEFDLVYANTVVSCNIIVKLKNILKCRIICHIRELEISIIQYCGIDQFHLTIPIIDLFIADSEAVKQNLISKHDIPEAKIVKIFEYINFSEAQVLNNKVSPLMLKKQRESIGISGDDFVVVSSGTTDWRKGVDLIVHIAKKVHDKGDFPIHFIWIGGENFGLAYEKLIYDVIKTGIQDYVHFLGTQENPLNFFVLADLFMLCSREEPVGVVALEAASLKKPVLCFDQAGGMPEFVGNDCGFIVPYLNLDAMANRIIELYNNRVLLQKLGNRAFEKVQGFDINIAGRNLRDQLVSFINS